MIPVNGFYGDVEVCEIGTVLDTFKSFLGVKMAIIEVDLGDFLSAFFSEIFQKRYEVTVSVEFKGVFLEESLRFFVDLSARGCIIQLPPLKSLSKRELRIKGMPIARSDRLRANVDELVDRITDLWRKVWKAHAPWSDNLLWYLTSLAGLVTVIGKIKPE